MTTKNTHIHEGGANVFADLGLPDADNHFLKAQIVAEVDMVIADGKNCIIVGGICTGLKTPCDERDGNFTYGISYN